MTLKEWSDFNNPVLANPEWIICILDHSYKNTDKIMEALMRDHHAVRLFGDYEVKRVQVAAANESGYNTIRLLIWPPDKS